MNRMKSMLTVLGAVTLLVLVANGVSVAATGKNFLLGKANSAGTLTTLTRTTNGPVLSLKSRTGAGAPLVVNGKGRVANLNADRLDGLDSSVLRSRSYVWTREITSAEASTSWAYTLAGLPSGTYQVGYSVFPNGSVSTGDTLTCYITLQNSGGGALRYVGENRSVSADGLRPSVSGTGIMEVGGTQSIALKCDASFPFFTFTGQEVQIFANPTTLAGGSSNLRSTAGARLAK